MTETEQRQFEADARAYLTEQLGPRAPQALGFEDAFDEAPLDGEERTVLFSFFLEPERWCGNPLPPPRHYVAVGRTTPNYFPAYGLGVDDAYSFHVGLRFMLELEIGLVDPSREPPGAREALREFVRLCAPAARLDGDELAALFRCQDQHFAVYRLTLSGGPVYCLGADCPPGFYRLTEYPPQVALTLHLGKLIRAEARQERRLRSG